MVVQLTCYAGIQGVDSLDWIESVWNCIVLCYLFGCFLLSFSSIFIRMGSGLILHYFYSCSVPMHALVAHRQLHSTPGQCFLKDRPLRLPKHRLVVHGVADTMGLLDIVNSIRNRRKRDFISFLCIYLSTSLTYLAYLGRSNCVVLHMYILIIEKEFIFIYISLAPCDYYILVGISNRMGMF